MDLFAVILISITILAICGICLFILICALQPKILRYLHQKTYRTYYVEASKKDNDIENDLNINNFDLATKSISQDLDKQTYLKILERSVRTGRQIQDEKNKKIHITTPIPTPNTANYHNNDSHIDLFYFRRQNMNENASSATTTNISRSIEI
ncbi:unnamed protein product [Rotaria sp. Silwood1]|nr:unnamed protein product [Rotaria sp. Silwood1]CAF3738456.1 unnamed protein product [Rotaria sp. Silwood1]CAF3832590.1 unnamed protein product [Rotaria sp. Silwood1]CAF4698054.1 unnamed protein product [Rotaria sp. Silwood1]CAF4731047.1 unnamed protein product [Rotaria sp. Silwood1]